MLAYRLIYKLPSTKKQIWKSLGDVSHAEAVRLVRIESVRVDELFADARKRAAPSVAAELTDAQIEHVARGVLYEMEAAASPMPFDERERAERLESALEDAAMTSDDRGCGLAAPCVAVAEKERLGVDRTSRTFPRLVEAVQRALIESIWGMPIAPR